MDSFSENISSAFGYILDIIASERIRKLVARGEIQREASEEPQNIRDWNKVLNSLGKQLSVRQLFSFVVLRTLINWSKILKILKFSKL